MTKREMDALKKRLEKAWSNTKDPSLYPHLCEKASLELNDKDWDEIEKFTANLRKNQP